MGQRNNQPNNGVGGGMGVGEAMQTGGTHGGGRLVNVLGGELSDEKINEIIYSTAERKHWIRRKCGGELGDKGGWDVILSPGPLK